MILSCVDAAHHQFKVACHNWQSIAETGRLLLSRRDMMQFKALCDNVYYICRDHEDDLYEEWEELTRARPRYISIMDGLIMKEDEQEMND